MLKRFISMRSTDFHRVAGHGHLNGVGFGSAVGILCASLLLGKLISSSFEQIRKRSDSLLELVS